MKEKTSAIDLSVRHDVTCLSDDDVFLIHEGSHFRLYDKLGAHIVTAEDGTQGVYFAVVAPNARSMTVMGDFNNWSREAHPLAMRKNSGIWEGFIPKLEQGARYKFHVEGPKDKYRADRADPCGFRHETPPKTASVVWPIDYAWSDHEWMRRRKDASAHQSPVAIYEVHLGSWMRATDGNHYLNYREMAVRLAEYVNSLGFTHVELMPVMEHPFYGSWGYQCTGYFAPTSRYGTPQDFMFLVDHLHQQGIGVILDWVPGHFPNDEHGLGYFDGTHLYEDPDPRRGIHPEWDSYVFNYERPEVQSFLYSNAFFWLDKYHADGLRVDAVSSMLYLDFAREKGEWIPNKFGGNENLEASAFLRRLNREIYTAFPDVQTYAEEATSWPGVTRPAHTGGLGFGYKWDMGWMNDTLDYFSNSPGYRRNHHNKLTFRNVYAFSENYVMPLSHDEVVHGKKSLLSKMPGEYEEQFANLRLLLGNQYLQPGKKLLFMGGEFGQWKEWAHDEALDWDLLAYPIHDSLRRWVGDLNRLYREEPALHLRDHDPAGFEWIDCSDYRNSITSFVRKDGPTANQILAVFNHSVTPQEGYRIGVPRSGRWTEILNSDAEIYGGRGWGNYGGRLSETVSAHGQAQSLSLVLPALSCLVMKHAET